MDGGVGGFIIFRSSTHRVTCGKNIAIVHVHVSVCEVLMAYTALYMRVRIVAHVLRCTFHITLAP
jgi:hypothetical protein